MCEWESDNRLPEVIGECDQCGANVMEDEHYKQKDDWLLCEKCYWMLYQAGEGA